MSNSIETILAEFQAKDLQIEALTESVRDLALRYEDIGWDLLSGDFDEASGPTLENLKDWDEKLSDLAASNPLMRRGAQLRHGYIFGKGVVFTEVKPGSQRVIDDELNERALFSVQAYEEMNLALFTGGNFFTLYDKTEKRFIRVPLRQITGVVTSEDSDEEIRYVKRTWTVNKQTREVWYPLNTTKNPAAYVKNDLGERTPVDRNRIMYMKTSNKQVGWTFGVPDALAALSWVLAYSEYLKDNSVLVKAYSQFALKVTKKTKAGVENAAVKISKPGTGGTAAMIEGNELTAMPATGSQVNFNNGQPLAAMVATSLGVSVIALLGSPGAAGGSYGAAQTLDSPTLIGMEAIQDSWSIFFRQVLRGLGSPNASAEFPAIETDPVYRVIGAAAQALSVGGLTQREFFDLCHDLFDIADPDSALPGPEWYNVGAAVVAAEASATQDQIDATVSDPIARQGNSGAVGSITQGDTNNDA